MASRFLISAGRGEIKALAILRTGRLNKKPLRYILKVENPHKGASGVRLIGIYKVIYGLLLGGAGLGIFHLINHDLGEVLEHFISMAHLDPDNHISQGILRLSGLTKKQLEAIGAGTLFYAILEMFEGAGLFLERHWAEYLTVIATGILLLPECYEIAMKISLVRIAVFIVNLGIVTYLVYQLRRDRAA